MLSRFSSIEPLDVLTVLPDSDFPRPIYFDKGASSVLLSIEPFAIVDSAIFPLESTLALALIGDKFAFILLTIGPLE